jgi:signal transduction histidine kinase
MKPDSLADAFLEQSPTCNWIVDRGLTFIRIYGDPLPILGKPAAELVGRPLAEALDLDSSRSWKERMQRALAGESLTLRDRHGSRTWNISVFPISAENNICCAGALAREFTPWTRAEHELRYTVLGALKAMEFERKSASRFLHDSVGQNLTALGLQLDLMRMDLETVSPELCARIAEMQKMLEQMMEEVREYSYELNPSTVERAGLRPALDRLAGRVRERFTGSLRINVDPSLKIDPKIAAAMYQIAQEAVENAVQHSSCSLIEIAVKSTRSGGFLEIRDNGKGFDPSDLQGNFRGLGLLSMEHYAAQAGLDLSIASNRETGTTVRAVSPEPA